MASTPTLFLSLPKIVLPCPSSKPNQYPCSSSSLCLSSLFGKKFTSSSVGHIGHRFNKISPTATASVTLSLPTLKHKDSAKECPIWSSRAIRSFVLAESEARYLCYSNTGTEALLLGILTEGTSLAAKILRAKGMSLLKVRQDIVDLLGRSNYFHDTDLFPPLTKQAQAALDWAIDEKLKSGGEGEITVNHLLLGIWAQEQSSGHKIMAAYGFDDQSSKEIAGKIDEEIDLSHKNVKRNLLSLK